MVSRLLVAHWRQANEFPNALRVVKPYLSMIESKSGNLFFLHDSDLPERFPEETLEFLWCLCSQRQLRWLRFWFIVKKW